jgi:hypothetical protein
MKIRGLYGKAKQSLFLEAPQSTTTTSNHREEVEV